MPATASEQLDTFEASVREGLDDFMHSRGATYESGFSCFEGLPRKLKSRSEGIPGLFWFICRYKFPAMYLDVGFGDRESLVEAMIGYPSLALEHHPGILAEAAGRNEGGLSGRAWVVELPFMQVTVKELTSGLKSIWDLLESPSEEVLDRAQQILGRRLIFAQEEQRRRDRQRDTIEASTAFHEGNFSRAVELLSRYERDDEFSEANRKMLTLAKKENKARHPTPDPR